MRVHKQIASLWSGLRRTPRYTGVGWKVFVRKLHVGEDGDCVHWMHCCVGR